MIRKSKAIWNGTGKDGNGKLTSTSGVERLKICEDGNSVN
jgi:hypothetical protein